MLTLRNATREAKTALTLLQKSYYSTRIGLESASQASGVRGKTFLITGATSGIGLTTAELLAQQGATVLVAGRALQKVKKLIKNLRLHTGNQSIFGYCYDLSTLQATRALASHVTKDVHKYFGGTLHCLINNAGVFLEEKEITFDGLEMTWAVNTASPFLLTAELLPLISGKIVNCSSISLADNINLENTQEKEGSTDDGLEYEHGGHAAYGNSKLALNMWSYRLADKLTEIGSPVTVNCIDPGTVSTKLLYAGWGDVSYVALPAEEAHDVFWAATDSSLDGVTGKYFVNRKSTKSSSVSYDKEMQKKVWDLLVAQTGAKYDFKEGKQENLPKNTGEEKEKKAGDKRRETPAGKTALKASSQVKSPINLQELMY